MTNPLVSIIIPCYNGAKFIAETIQSVINQTYPNWELIIVNDGSSDNSEKLIKTLIDKEFRATLVNKTNSGVSDTRNKGISFAKGDYITFLDADDVWFKDNLEKKVTFLSSKNFDIVYSFYSTINEHSKSLTIKHEGTSNPTLKDFLYLKGNYNTKPSGLLYAKKIFTNFQGFDTNLSNNADQDILIQLVAKGFKIGLIEEILWNYRIHENNMSNNVSILEKDTLYLFKKCSSMKLFKNFWFERKCYAVMYYMLAGSWWKDGNNKKKGFYYMYKAIMANPLSIKLFFKK